MVLEITSLRIYSKESEVEVQFFVRMWFFLEIKTEKENSHV